MNGTTEALDRDANLVTGFHTWAGLRAACERGAVPVLTEQSSDRPAQLAAKQRLAGELKALDLAWVW